MNVQAFRKRIVRVLTTPPEILYALTRHWIFILGCLTLGTLLFLARAMTEPVYYEGRAALLVNPVETLVPEESFGRSRRAYTHDRTEVQRFLTAQAGILWSDSVLRKLVRRLGWKAVLAQEENREKAKYGKVRRAISDVRQSLSQFFEYLKHPNLQDFGEENEMQRAIRAFRRRSNVLPDPRANSIDLFVFGNDRRQIDMELNAWIWAYNERLEDMARESSEKFLNNRILHWSGEEERARKELEEFKARNPAVTQQAVDLLREQTTRIDVRRSDLERAAAGEKPIEIFVEGPAANPRAGELLSRFQSLRLEELALRTEFPDESTPLRRIREEIGLVEKELLSLGTTAGLGEAEKKELLKRQLQSVTDEYTAKLVQMNQLREKLDDRMALEETYKRTKEFLDNYKFTSKKSEDFLEQHKTVTVQTGDPPVVNTQPHEAFPYGKVIYGALGGLAISFVLSIVFELLSNRVRFKNDIIGEIGIPVVEVVPRR